MMNEITTSMLFFRPGEEFTLERVGIGPLFSIPANCRVYMACLVDLPAMPNTDIESMHPSTKPYTVIVCELYPAEESDGLVKMGWVHLGYDTKVMLGNALIKRHAKSNEWWWLILDTMPDYS